MKTIAEVQELVWKLVPKLSAKLPNVRKSQSAFRRYKGNMRRLLGIAEESCLTIDSLRPKDVLTINQTYLHSFFQLTVGSEKGGDMSVSTWMVGTCFFYVQSKFHPTIHPGHRRES